ncbi:hypothetical protein [Microseira wollei]|uniref:Transposase n=1 Tax=Microseira wollei NIES-4236 TaxID=2530354 RepID=A0AAV3X8F3_9CYAN|nr:hypothetical protein [Microseira wollei]GET36532.1 hypothetical protein MiSe_12830 [Microseira wollei NIES-4236]
MTKPPQGQPTRIQLRTIIERIQKLQPVAIGLVIIAASLKIVESVNNIVQFRESVCRTDLSAPLCPPEKLDPPQWIGTKIEDVYIKKLQNYEPETTLVVTDKFPDRTEKKDISVLRNVDQEISEIGVKKRNSGQYEAILRRAKKNGTPLCLKIYGKRKFATSEFKNIIEIDEKFPDSKTYDSLNPEERDKKCKDKHEIPIPPQG